VAEDEWKSRSGEHAAALQEIGKINAPGPNIDGYLTLSRIGLRQFHDSDHIWTAILADLRRSHITLSHRTSACHHDNPRPCQPERRRAQRGA
jgi:hypothetical protein